MRISDWSSDVCSSDLEPRDRLSVVLLAGLLAISSGSDSASCAHAPPAQAAGMPANSDDWHSSPRNRAQAVNETARSRGVVFGGERNDRAGVLSDALSARVSVEVCGGVSGVSRVDANTRYRPRVRGGPNGEG